MDKEMITAESLLRDIYEAESSLRWFEQKYGLFSKTFYHMYQQGKLRDEDPNEIQEYMEWSAGMRFIKIAASNFEWNSKSQKPNFK